MTKFITLFLLIIFGTLQLEAQPANNRYKIKLDSDTNTVELKVLAWNIYMLPARTFMHTGQLQRAKFIADTLLQTNYDVIVLTEAFHPKARRYIADQLRPQYPYQTNIANQCGGIKTNSGVWIVSKLPVEILGEIQFNDCAGADCWARKGAMMISVEKNGKQVQIVGTHLQSDEGAKRDTVRYRQYRDIYQKLLKPHQRDKVPQIIAGDMNTIADTYSQMLHELNATDNEISGKRQHTWTTDDYSQPDAYLFDYILLRANNCSIISEKRCITEFKHDWTWRKKKRYHLSDHYGLELNILFSN